MESMANKYARTTRDVSTEADLTKQWNSHQNPNKGEKKDFFSSNKTPYYTPSMIYHQRGKEVYFIKRTRKNHPFINKSTERVSNNEKDTNPNKKFAKQTDSNTWIKIERESGT